MSSSTPVSAPFVKWDTPTNELVQHASEATRNIATIAVSALKNTHESSVYLFAKIQVQLEETPLSPIIEKIHSICTDLEKIFNISGCAPWLGVLSGSIRTVFGQGQAVFGIALTIFSEIGLVVSNLSKTNPLIISKWQTLSKCGIELTIHGCLNAIRGTGEAIIGSYTLGLANIFLIIPNLLSERNFNPYFPYGSLSAHLHALKSEIQIYSEVEA